MQFDYLARNAKAQAGAFAGGFGGEEGVEDLAEELGRDARAIIANFQHYYAVACAERVGGTGAKATPVFFAQDAGAGGKGKAPAFFHRLQRVSDEVDEHLLDPRFIGK